MYPRRKTNPYLQVWHFLMATACSLLFELQLYTAVRDQVLQKHPAASQLFPCLFCALQLFCFLLGCSYGPDIAIIQVIHPGGLVDVAQVNIRWFGTGGQ